jgi:hypothetical protein
MTTIDFPPQLVLQQLIQGYQVTQCIYVAAKLGIADLLKDGPRNSEELAQATGTHAPSLYRVLRLLTYRADLRGQLGLVAPVIAARMIFPRLTSRRGLVERRSSCCNSSCCSGQTCKVVARGSGMISFSFFLISFP